MDFTPDQLKTLRAKFDLAEDASEEDILAALDAPAASAAEGPRAEGAEEEQTEEAPEAKSDEELIKETEPETPPASASADEDDGPVTVDRKTWDETRRGALDGAAARAEQVKAHREGLITSAVKAGKFPPSREDHYRKLFEADAAGTEELINRLEPGVIPVDQRGSSADAGGASASATTDEEMQNLFPGQYRPRSEA